ncbi:hypothetical protein [Cellulomonas sp. KRMCY2]|uniref:hypothetical protein n=1 Tax=Cellulomonas sp. KRMCY2 TaxID=1304865 RepID=UPI00045E8764|nr:hypothetical protein [Cellulomonas sp. KRMCY2]
MGFLDKAKAAASDLAAKADTALGSSGLTGGPKPAGAGDVDRYFHDLGVLTYLEASGRPADPADRARVMTNLQELDSSGAIRSFALHTAPPPAPGMAGAVPPPPGMAGTTPPPPGMAGTTPPPPFGAGGPPSPEPPQAPAPVPQAPPAAPVAAPPPPSWMTTDDSGDR